MRLSQIIVHGFKSFAKKTTIDITHSVTGVVGPNGSGKSNVAEAIRFVLGEQSMKSMRGKLGSDLIFKGSEFLPIASRASVSIMIDNRDKSDYAHASMEIAPFLAYDEIRLARMIYSDGTSDYTINDAKVRLKDVQELLSFAGIGASAHTIINQGETDKILLSSPKEKKEAIEDALSLRVYHMRIDESKRKLERVKEKVREVELLRKEIAPHITHLKKQVDKIESKEKEIKKLNGVLSVFLKREEKEITTLKNNIEENGTSVSLAIIAESIKKEISSSFLNKNESETKEEKTVDKTFNNKNNFIIEMRELRTKKDSITKNIGRLEAERAFLEREIKKSNESDEYNIKFSYLKDVKNNIKSSFAKLKVLIDESKKEEAQAELVNTENISAEFFDSILSNDQSDKKIDLEVEVKKRNAEIVDLEEKEKEANRDISLLQEKIDKENEEERKVIEEKHTEEKKHLVLEGKLKEFESMIALRREEESRLNLKEERFNSLLNEGMVIIGKEILGYKEANTEDNFSDTKNEDLLRAIERAKLRIEEAGVVNASDVIEEYKTVNEREEYLKKELTDIKESEEKLYLLIDDLTKTLELKFEHGVKQISDSFGKYFNDVFPGGKARLTSVPIIKINEEGEEIKEFGLDIDISLPAKKVKELAMLSGGEKALTSIALLFAMSSLTPPPFMVLDETDAPLDEHNAQKYGLMIKELAKKSKLLVITHNRETMNYCDMLYGVTLGAEGASKLLSINLKE